MNSNKTIGERKKANIKKSIEILEQLKDNGIDLSRVKREIKRNGRYRSSLLKEIAQPKIDILKIIEKNGLDPDLKIGYKILRLNEFYRHFNDSEMIEEKRRIENLGIFEVRTEAAMTLEILDILKQNGVDVSKINMVVRKDGKRTGVLLREIDQPGIDIIKIIEEYGLNPNDNIGGKIARINQGYKGRIDNPITEEEKKKAEELGIIRNNLTRKEKDQQQLQNKYNEVKKLKNQAETLLSENQILK